MLGKRDNSTLTKKKYTKSINVDCFASVFLQNALLVDSFILKEGER